MTGETPGELKTDFDFFGGIPYELRDRGGSLPGSNDFTARPSAEHPYPVILVHGTGGARQTNWGAYVPLLHNAGYSVFALTYGAVTSGIWPVNQIGGMRTIESSAHELGDFIEKVLAATGAERVDLVAHSQGTLLSGYYVKLLGGAKHVRKVISLAPLWQGTGGDLGRMATTVAAHLGLARHHLPVFESLNEMLPGSDLLRRLWADENTPYARGVEYTNISSRHDELVIPYTSGQVPGGEWVTVHNIVVQTSCPEDRSDHLAICGSKRAAYMVLNAIDPEHTVEVPCYPVHPYTGT